MPHRLLEIAKFVCMLSSNLTSSSARATYAAAAAVAWLAQQSCEDFSVLRKQQFTSHQSPLRPSLLMVAPRTLPASRLTLNSYTTPINAPHPPPAR
jgi:hypothetical protein